VLFRRKIERALHRDRGQRRRFWIPGVRLLEAD
jgi:hypothetical protein